MTTDTTGDTLENAPTAGQRVEDAVTYARGRLEDAAAYFRDRDARDILDDVKEYAKAHPTQALIGAAILGLVAGQLIRRR
jgi:ElaB/YqjD/DUF883 family membrane-anchored ribosome-binding protein